jgi:hypothetical protein
MAGALKSKIGTNTKRRTTAIKTVARRATTKALKVDLNWFIEGHRWSEMRQPNAQTSILPEPIRVSQRGTQVSAARLRGWTSIVQAGAHR